jgi:serine/threonine kinase 16
VHQDIKPENILISDEGKPLLTDFGSVRLAEIAVTNRAQALAVADEAASFCTVSYRAPELFDPPKGCKLDTRTDVWGLGCLLFAWWFGLSPWECEFSENGRVRVVDCSHSRVLSKMPRPIKPTKEDAVILDNCEWILEKNFTVRVFTADIIKRLQESLETYAVKDLRRGASNV